jgi:tetratricopeptide (TPR) repeat protein
MMAGKVRNSMAVGFLLSLQVCSIGRAETTAGPAASHCRQNPAAEAARQTPGDLQRLKAAGEACFRAEQWRESAYWLSRAYRLSHADREIGYELATAEMRADDLSSAERQLEQMFSQEDTAKLHGLRGELLEIKGDYSGAAREYYRAVELETTEDDLFELADFLLQHKKYDGYLAESVKFFRYGVSKFANSAKMHVGLGVALYASEEYDEALKTLCKAVDLAPADPKPITFLGMARRVSPELAQEVDARIKDFAERYPGNPAANYEYALSLWDRQGGEAGKNLDEIDRLLLKAIASAPQWYEPHYQLGLSYEKQGRYADAIGAMRKASQLQPAFKPAHFRLAILYKRIGDQQHAAAEAAKARQLDNTEIESATFKSANN